jgi:hypothetical protein
MQTIMDGTMKCRVSVFALTIVCLLCLPLVPSSGSSTQSQTSNQQHTTCTKHARAYSTRVEAEDQALRAFIPHCAVMEIDGGGPLWKRLTGLNQYTAIFVRNKQMMYALANDCRRSDKEIIDPLTASFWDSDSFVNVNFCTSQKWPVESVLYGLHKNRAYDQDRSEDGTPMLRSWLPGSGKRFESLIHSLASRAHAHDPSVKIGPASTYS